MRSEVEDILERLRENLRNLEEEMKKLQIEVDRWTEVVNSTKPINPNPHPNLSWLERLGRFLSNLSTIRF